MITIPAQILPPDKAQHAIGGAMLYLVGTCAADIFDLQRPALCGLLLASSAGVLKEAMDWWLNARAMRAGQMATHEVSWLDWLATTAGAATMCAAAMLGGV